LCIGLSFVINSLDATMSALIFHWILSTVSLIVVAYLFPGIAVEGWAAALVAPIVMGLANATLGLVLKILTLPLSLLTFGLFFLVINALMLQVAAALVPGFYVAGFWSAFFGAIMMSLVSTALRALLTSDNDL
jgi:putative membrane protein